MCSARKLRIDVNANIHILLRNEILIDKTFRHYEEKELLALMINSDQERQLLIKV